MTTLQIMPAYSDAYERDKLRILRSLNDQIQHLATKLDSIVSQTEQIYFKNSLPPAGVRHSPYPLQKPRQSKAQHINKMISSSENNMHQPMNNRATSSFMASDDHFPRPSKKINSIKAEPTTSAAAAAVAAARRPPDTTAKRNKQQRQFNTFVRESINQLLGPDFMRTHDVQDIDQSVMEMIRKEAVENYLPDNIRPRRAWHLAKASLRTLKRTLNNRNPNPGTNLSSSMESTNATAENMTSDSTDLSTTNIVDMNNATMA